MDLNGQNNRRLSSLISRFQKNGHLPEKPEAKIEPQHRNAATSKNDDHLNTSGPFKGVASSKAGFSPVIQSSHYPEQPRAETRNNLARDWVANETSPASEVTTTVAKEISPALKVKTTVADEISPASEAKTTGTKETSPASKVKTTVIKETNPASNVKTTVAKEISPASEVKATATKETSPASEGRTTVIKETSPASNVKTTVAEEISPASEAKTTATKEISPASQAKTTVSKETSPASEVKTTVAKEISPASEGKPTVTKETSPASEIKTANQPISVETERATETVIEDGHNLPEAETSDSAEHVPDTEAEAEQEALEEEDGGRVDYAEGNDEDYDDIADFDVDDLLEDSSEEELPTLQEIYQRCQTIKKRRFYQDLSNVWQEKVQTEEKDDAIKILSACGFGKGDEMQDGLDKALSLVPERFWRHDSKANEINIDDLKTIVEEKKDAEERAQYRHYQEAEGAKSGKTRLRRSAIATGGGGKSSAILHNYLKMNLLKSHVPLYYFPSYLHRFKDATEKDSEDEEKYNDSD